MAVNLELVERKISLILQDLENLRELEKLDLSDYLADFKNEDAARLAKLAGLRNRLSHEYNGLDEAIIHQAVKELVAELPTYLEAIRNFVNQQ